MFDTIYNILVGLGVVTLVIVMAVVVAVVEHLRRNASSDDTEQDP